MCLFLIMEKGCPHSAMHLEADSVRSSRGGTRPSRSPPGTEGGKSAVAADADGSPFATAGELFQTLSEDLRW